MSKGKSMSFEELKAQTGIDGRSINPQATVSEMRERIKKNLSIRNRQQFVSRYHWCTLDGSPFPNGIDPEIIERILYYRFKLIAFKDGDKYWTVPFALNGGIDVYGRYTKVSPLTFNGTVEYYTDEDDPRRKHEKYVDGDWNINPNLELAPSYNTWDIEPVQREGKTVDRCVILNDYVIGIAQTAEPRYKLSRVFLEQETDIIALIRHNLLASAKTYTFRVMDESQAEIAMDELEDMTQDILDNGRIFYPITSSMPIDELFNEQQIQTQEYWECFVSMDNLRENMMGIENNGIFKKKERELQAEAEKEGSQADLVYQDGLYQRQKFCEIFNAMYGEQLWCEESPVINKTEDNNEDLGEVEDESGERNENI